MSLLTWNLLFCDLILKYLKLLFYLLLKIWLEFYLYIRFMRSNADQTITFSGLGTKNLVSSALVTESLAILAALAAALEHERYDIQVFSDNMTLIHLLCSEDLSFFILCDIRAILSLFNSFIIGFIPRLENILADSLAKEVLWALDSV